MSRQIALVVIVSMKTVINGLGLRWLMLTLHYEIKTETTTERVFTENGTLYRYFATATCEFVEAVEEFLGMPKGL